MFWQIFALIVSLLSFLVAAYFYRWVKALPTAEGNLGSIGDWIRAGAYTFLKTEYRVLLRFAGAVVVLILLFYPAPIWQGHVLDNIIMALAYIAGTVLSAVAGWIGISIATIANVKSATAARQGLQTSFMAGFRGGAVMGLAVVGTSLSGASILYLLTSHSEIVLAFSFGASSLALFAKAGGGIFTKTADISADLTGKVELGIPEDDPRNPAVIADNVGDNVGDVAGMGADLFDSNIASIAAAIILASPLGQVHLIFAFGSLGLLASIIGVLAVRVKPGGHPGKALNNGTYLTTAIFAVLTLAATLLFQFEIRLWLATFIGLLSGTVIGFSSELFTSDTGKPVARVAEASQSGPAFTIITGFSYGLISSFPSILGIAVAAVASYKVAEPLGDGYALLGISLAAIGMLSIVGMIISNDAYGPIVDNARGLAEMGSLGDDVLEITDQLDSAGNTAKAITKGFAIGAAGLTVIALLAAFQEIVRSKTGEILSFSILDPVVFFGLMTGIAVPAVFSAMLMMGVGRNAERMVAEIHRQFAEIPGLREGKAGVMPDYNRCIDIATVGAIKELIPAGLLAILVTLAVGFIGGVSAIGGFLAGNITAGLLLALLMSNSGGLWDNAKKYIEAGHFGGKGSEAHKAGVIGDTVGDPFKDTAGPSINTQVTVVSLVASLSASLFMAFSILG
ncbi:MAG: sodium-translocating pyrophosphatase [Clostridia bacterium]|nr:sodium-translocating pyrophosphatase [Clostridia bacterium]NCC76626.1 sodium-translocating pyrophosphatase [Clostridia bacterium]